MSSKDFRLRLNLVDCCNFVNMFPLACTQMQAKDFMGLTKKQALDMDPEKQKEHCGHLSALDKGMIAHLKGCSDELMKTLSMAMEVCASGSTSGSTPRSLCPWVCNLSLSYVLSWP